MAPLSNDDPHAALLWRGLMAALSSVAPAYGYESVLAVHKLLLLQYEQGGFMTWHKDAGAHGDNMSVTIQLTDSGDYEGGDLVIRDDSGNWRCADRGKGFATIFPARYWHRVTPITRGVRHSIITAARAANI